MPGVPPWNYGNYYLGNTTMQMMPMMLNKVHQYGQMQAMAALGNAGLLGSAPVMPNMAMNPCCLPPSGIMPMSSPMMAASASPLPVAFNPLVQGMYPMASMNPVNWMTPGSFMSALSAGPMPYRPPSFDFPSNVGMVMTIPYGTPNPLFSTPNFSSFGASASSGGGFSCCYSYSFMPPVAPAPAPAAISYYPQPVSVPQPYPVPVPIPNVQQVPVPQPVSAVAPPIVAGACPCPCPCLSMGNAGLPLYPSQGGLSNGNFGQPPVLSSNQHLTTSTPLPVYNATDPSQRLIGQSIPMSNVRSTNNQQPSITHSAAKTSNYLDQTHDSFSDRVRRHLPSVFSSSHSSYNLSRSQPRSDPIVPPILHGQLISDSGWLPKSAQYSTMTSIFSGKKRKRLLTPMDMNRPMLHPSGGSHVSFRPYHRRPRSSSSTSEYDCAICQEQRDKRRLHKHYDSSTVSSLLSSPKHSRKHQLFSNASPFSSKSHTPSSTKHKGYQSHRRHQTKIKIKNKTPSPPPSTQKSTSPILLRQSLIENKRPRETIHEVKESDIEDEEEQEQQRQQQKYVEKRSSIGNESITDKSDRYESKISLRSIDE